jgi:hypothetical protein
MGPHHFDALDRFRRNPVELVAGVAVKGLAGAAHAYAIDEDQGVLLRQTANLDAGAAIGRGGLREAGNAAQHLVQIGGRHARDVFGSQHRQAGRCVLDSRGRGRCRHGDRVQRGTGLGTVLRRSGRGQAQACGQRNGKKGE